ncbi:hypothetical protein Y032_0526g2932 [Ancylostoma ceylanicum]|nr:hypothetical protein Y032_0526g2932 [Ancylostoma ceylanicum]
MAVSFSSWKELTSILDSDKKLLKKPNLPLMLNQLNSLSLRMHTIGCEKASHRTLRVNRVACVMPPRFDACPRKSFCKIFSSMKETPI